MDKVGNEELQIYIDLAKTISRHTKEKNYETKVTEVTDFLDSRSTILNF